MSFRHTQKNWPDHANRLTTAPTVEPVTPDELRTQLRETSAGLPDVEANDLIETAREWFEEQLGVALIQQSWTLTMDDWPIGETPWWDGVVQGHINSLDQNSAIVAIGLPRWPLSSVTSVTTYADDDTSTAVVVADTFNIDTASIKGRMALKNGQSWPVASRGVNAIAIEYVAGHGATAAYVPAPMKRAVKQIAAGLYTHRGDGCEAVADGVTMALIQSYKLVRV